MSKNPWIPAEPNFPMELIVDSMFQGAVLLLLVYNLLLYVQAKKNFNLSYACYLFFISLNFLNLRLHLVSSRLAGLVEPSMALKFEAYYFEAPMYITYFLFMQHYLETSTSYPKIHKLLLIMISNSSFEILLTNVMFMMGEYESLFMMVQGLKVINMVCAVMLVPLFYRQYNQLIKFLFFGGSALMVGTILYFISLQSVHLVQGWWRPHYFLYVGILIEILIFSLGIGYRFKLIQEEKIDIQNKLIAEMRDKEAYQQRIKEEMEIELENRAEQIRVQSNTMYQVRLSHELSETKMKLLSARMNPHFLFNCLNSLKGLLLERKSATRYVDKFAVLLRSILMQSEAAHISLKEEVATLRNYLDLENLRFDNALEYTIIIDPRLDLQYVHIPPMLIQPLIENAIWHGLRPMAMGERKLTLSFHQQGEMLIVVVDDNGVGRQRQADTESEHKSVALNLIHKRMQIMNADPLAEESFMNIQDKKHPDGRPAGTKVSLYLYIGD